MQKMDNLNILLVGNSGCGKTSLIFASIENTIKQKKCLNKTLC